MKIESITEQITKRISENLQKEIIELLKPICRRIESGKSSKRQYSLEVIPGRKRHWLEVVKLLEVMIYEQEIEEAVELAVQEFIEKVDKQ